MTLATGQVLQNRYRIDSFLSQGGMGAIYRAWDTRLSVPVAFKEMTPQPGLDPHRLAQLRHQFHREAAVLARLDHPHLVHVTDFFEEGGNIYLVMRFVEGNNLAERIQRRGALPEGEVLAWSAQLLDALAYCHSQGVIHRDVKPHNVIIRPNGRVMLVDFGLVKLWDPHDPRTRTAMRGMGTPEYAPPEQYDPESGHTDARSDVYGLGATMYHALTGRAPPTATQRIASRRAFQPPRALNQRISPATEAVVLRAMELTVEDRFQSAQEMRATLTGAGAGPTGTRLIPARPGPAARVEKGRAIPTWAWGLGAAAALAVLALLVGTVLTWGGGGAEAGPTPPAEETATTLPAAVTQAVTKTATAPPSPSMTATGRPTRTPTPLTTATAQPTSTPARTTTSTPTAPPTSTPARTPTSTETPRARLTATSTPARASAPEPLAPAQGRTYGNPITFEWRGSLSAGQAYQVAARHAGSGHVIQSGSLTSQSWTTDLPGDKYGEWRWTVSVVQGGRTAATSSEWMFWFDPSGGGGGGGGSGGRATNTPP